MVDWDKIGRDARARETPARRMELDSMSAARNFDDGIGVVVPAVFSRCPNGIDDPRPHAKDQVLVSIEPRWDEEGKRRDLLHFRGAVTGYESYDLERNARGDSMATPAQVEAGTVRGFTGEPGRSVLINGGGNHYDSCSVKVGDVSAAIAGIDAKHAAIGDAGYPVVGQWTDGECVFPVKVNATRIAALDGYHVDAPGLVFREGKDGLGAGLEGMRLLPIVLSEEMTKALAGTDRIAIGVVGRSNVPPSGHVTFDPRDLAAALEGPTVDVGKTRVVSPGWDVPPRAPGPVVVAAFEGIDGDRKAVVALTRDEAARLSGVLDAATEPARDGRGARAPEGVVAAWERAGGGAVRGVSLDGRKLMEVVGGLDEGALSALGAGLDRTAGREPGTTVGSGKGSPAASAEVKSSAPTTDVSAPRGSAEATPAQKAAEALRRAKDKDGLVGIWMTREEVMGEKPGSTASRMVALLAPAIRHPGFDSRFKRTGEEILGAAGLEALRAGFGGGGGMRRLYVDAMAATAAVWSASPTDATLLADGMEANVERQRRVDARKAQAKDKGVGRE